MKFLRNYFFAKIFRQIWSVAAGRITFAKCAFSFFVFHEKFMNFHQKVPTRKYAMNSYGFGCLGRPKSLKSQKLPAEVTFPHFLAKVTIYYACNGYFRSKWSQMTEKCTFCEKVPFRAIWAPGRAPKPLRLSLLLARGAGWAHFSEKVHFRALFALLRLIVRWSASGT